MTRRPVVVDVIAATASLIVGTATSFSPSSRINGEVSMTQPRATLPLTSALRADVNDDSYGTDSSTERRRKLVDRTSVYNVYSSLRSPSVDVEPSLDFAAALEAEEELCYLDELPGTDAGQTCFVSPASPLSSDPESPQFLASLPFNTRLPPIARGVSELILRYLPIVMPLVAYTTYESTAKAFNAVVAVISSNSWQAVDGGQYQATIITPAINGLVVPSIALLFATLTSTTINTLRQRQVQICTSLNTEANDLRTLSTMIDCLPQELRGTKNHLREYLVQYASRVMAESRPGITRGYQMFIGSMDTEMYGFLSMWNKLSMLSYGTSYVDTYLPVANYTVSDSLFLPYQKQLSLTQQQRRSVAAFLSPSVFSETYGTLTRLRDERSRRLSALQSTYPVLHYVLLTLLALSICTAFLMETNQELLIFLSAIQLRILWSMLIGTFSALAVVNYDMRDPFQGNYSVEISVDQFYTIREAIQATIQMDSGGERGQR